MFGRFDVVWIKGDVELPFSYAQVVDDVMCVLMLYMGGVIYSHGWVAGYVGVCGSGHMTSCEGWKGRGLCHCHVFQFCS